MCVIVHKPKHITIGRDTVSDMWEHNPDGAGLSFFNSEGEIVIMKGFMRLSDLWAAIQPLQSFELVIHFRYATHGATTPAQTHPFVISHKEREAKGFLMDTKVPDAVLFHNGVISNFGDERISDTIDFTTRVLGPIKQRKRREVILETWKDLLKTVGSKYAILFDGKIELVGVFMSHKGLKCSNLSFNVSYGNYTNIVTKTSKGYKTTKRWVEAPSRAKKRAEERRKRLREAKKTPTDNTPSTVVTPTKRLETTRGFIAPRGTSIAMHDSRQIELGNLIPPPEDLSCLLYPADHVDIELLDNFEFREDIPEVTKEVLREIQNRGRGDYDGSSD